jgi:hypothetical protein
MHTHAYKEVVRVMLAHTLEKREKEATTQAVKNHSPHELRKRSHFGTGYRQAPSQGTLSH